MSIFVPVSSLRGGLAALVALGFVVSAGACAPTTANERLRAAALEQQPEGLIQLRSKGCANGHCAVYSLTIYTNREVSYLGGANVVAVGHREGQLADGRLNSVISDFEKIDFIDVPEHCCDCPGGPDPDGAATLVIDYRPGGVEKEIVHSDGCPQTPEAIKALEADIRKVAGADPWIAPAPVATEDSR